LFDLDNVLHDATHWQRWLWQLLARMGVQRDFHSFCGIWQRGYLHEVHRGGREFAPALRAFLVDSGLSAGQIDEVEAASAARRREFGDNVRPLPGVVKTLSHLATAKIGLGILANSECCGQELCERLERLGLAARFQFVLSSRDLGHVKPEAECYQSALDMLRLPAQSVAVVSCHAEDLMGAAAAGLKTVALNVEAYSHADFTLLRFEELLTVCGASAEPAKC
jgi:HAD superfamily hydrolase (TIGR01509 family)